MPIDSSAARRTGGVRCTPLSAATMFEPAKNGIRNHSALAKPRLNPSIVSALTPRYLRNQPSASSWYARPIRWHTTKATPIRRKPIATYTHTGTPAASVKAR